MPKYDADRARANSLKRYFGLSVDQYEEMLSGQEGKCAVCERDASEFKVRLAVDHNHHTGEIRGLLCSGCNHRVVGKYHSLQHIELLKRVVNYLSNGTGLFVPPTYLKRRRRTARKRKNA